MIKLREAGIIPAGINWVEDIGASNKNLGETAFELPDGRLFILGADYYYTRELYGGYISHSYPVANIRCAYLLKSGGVVCGGYDTGVWYTRDYTNWTQVVSASQFNNKVILGFLETQNDTVFVYGEFGVIKFTGITSVPINDIFIYSISDTVRDMCVHNNTVLGIATSGSGTQTYIISLNANNTWTHQQVNTAVRSLFSHGNLLFASAQQNVYVSTDNGATWNVSLSQIDIKFIGAILTGRLIVANGDNYVTNKGIWYSDDNGVTWTKASGITDLRYCGGCVTSNGRVYLVTQNHKVYYSDSETITAKNAIEKYLDQNGAQEIITQFKAYCNNLVGGN